MLKKCLSIIALGSILLISPINPSNGIKAASDSWTTGLSGGTARGLNGSAIYNGKIYSWAGMNNDYTRINTMDIYDIAGNSWSTGLAGGTARGSHTATEYHGKIYFWGGTDASFSALNTVDI